MPYSVKRSRPKNAEPALLTHCFVVTSVHGARVFERKSVNSALLRKMEKGTVFGGFPDGPWVKRLGGGYCVGISVREVV